MAERSKYLVAWVAGGAGVIMLYAAYKNVGPVSIITGRLSGDEDRSSIDTATVGETTPTVVTGDYGGDYSKGNTVPASLTDSQRAQRLANREIPPTLVPIPTQPNITVDIITMKSFMQVQTAYGGLISLTGGYRSQAEQTRQHKADPSRFAATGLHPAGLAIDINTDKVDVNAATLIDAFSKRGWYRVGRSGAMHWSYAVPG